MPRHAWLIITHNEFDILQRLVTALDAPFCDIYIHFDKKVRQLPKIRTHQSRLHILKNRVDVRWGSVSQIRCEFALFQAAAANGPYNYYHIISGTTLPLKPIDEIDRFFAKWKGLNILSGLSKDAPYQENLKIHRYNLFLSNYASRYPLLKAVSQFLWKSAIAVQRTLGLEINRSKEYFKASNWLSLTEDSIQYLLSRETDIFRTYRFTFCGDEYFVPTELSDSALKDKLFCYNKYLKVEMGDANPRILQNADYEELASCDCLFARKFSSDHLEIVDRIIRSL